MTYNLNPSRLAYSMHVGDVQPNYNHFALDYDGHVENEKNSDLSYDGKKNENTEDSDEREYIQKQYKMKIDSLIKNYEIKIAMEQETFQLKEMKYIEEIKYLKKQFSEKLNEKCPNLNEKCSEQQNCNICFNGQTITQMKNILQSVQSEHQNCLSERSMINFKLLSLEQKITIVQQQLQQTQQKYKAVKIQNKQLKSQKQNWQRERREKQRQIRQIQRQQQIKDMGFEQQIAKGKILQKELQGQIKKIQTKYYEGLSQIESRVAFKVNAHNQSKIAKIQEYKDQSFQQNRPGQQNLYKNHQKQQNCSRNSISRQQQIRRPLNQSGFMNTFKNTNANYYDPNHQSNVKMSKLKYSYILN